MSRDRIVGGLFDFGQELRIKWLALNAGMVFHGEREAALQEAKSEQHAVVRLQSGRPSYLVCTFPNGKSNYLTEIFYDEGKHSYNVPASETALRSKIESAIRRYGVEKVAQYGKTAVEVEAAIAAVSNEEQVGEAIKQLQQFNMQMHQRLYCMECERFPKDHEDYFYRDVWADFTCKNGPVVKLKEHLGLLPCDDGDDYDRLISGVYDRCKEELDGLINGLCAQLNSKIAEIYQVEPSSPQLGGGGGGGA